MRHLVFGKKYSGLFKIPFIDVDFIGFVISTRINNLTVKNLDGTTNTYVTSKFNDTTISNGMSFNKSYPSIYTGDVEIKSKPDNSDIYSINLNSGDTVGRKYNIQDFGTFIKQFPNLYSYKIGTYNYNDPARQPIIKGDLADIPSSVERILIDNMDVYNKTTDVFFNIDTLPVDSKLKYFNFSPIHLRSSIYIKGDLHNLPPGCQFFKISNIDNYTVTPPPTLLPYTAGKVWASSFDTFHLEYYKLSTSDTDNLLIDMNNSITTAIGSKVINLANCTRSSASDTAVAGLQAKGYTVTVLGVTVTDFNNLLFVNNVSALVSMNGNVYRTTDHKGGNTAIQFGSGNLVSINNLPSSAIWTFSFWMKTSQTQTAFSVLFELSDLWDSKNSFIGMLNYNTVNSLYAGINPSRNIRGNTSYNDNQWHHIVIVLDRNQTGENEIKIYKNKVLQSLTAYSRGENTGDFISDKLYIGGRSNSYQRPFIGATSPIKMFNYALTQTEIDNLYNE